MFLGWPPLDGQTKGILMTDTTSMPFKAPFFRRLWVVVVLTCSLLLMPVAMILALTGSLYRKRDGAWQPISDKARYIYGGLLVAWLVAATLKAFLQPGGVDEAWRHSADPALPVKSESADTANKEAAQAKASAPSPTENVSPENTDVDDSPNIVLTSRETEYGPALVLTSNDDRTFTIKRVIFNGRKEEKNCDLPAYGISANSTDMSNTAASIQSAYGTQLPKQLKRGDGAIFFSGCGAVMEIAIHTDLGVLTMSQNR